MSEEEPSWALEPFSDVRVTGTYEHFNAGGGYRGFLILVLDGQAAIGRLPLIPTNLGTDTWEALDERVGNVIQRLSALEVDQRRAYHRDLNEVTDMLHLLCMLEDETKTPRTP